MRIDKSRVIVGFKEYLCNLDIVGKFSSAEAMAWYQLTQAGYPKLPGLVSVVRRMRYLNAVLLQIEPMQFDDFRSIATSHDPIEYCDINYALKPADLTDTIAKSFHAGVSAGRVVRRHHISGFANSRMLAQVCHLALQSPIKSMS